MSLFNGELLVILLKKIYHTDMLSTPIGRLRLISIIDAISYLYLLYHSLYSKKILGIDEAVRIPGMIHGVFFTLFCFALLDAMLAKKWKLKTPFIIFLASIIPLAPIWVEIWLKKQK